MKIKKIINKIILLTILIIIWNCCICYAKTSDDGGIVIGDELLEGPRLVSYRESADGGGGGGAVAGDESLMLPRLGDAYKPELEGGKVVEMTNTLLGIIMVVGIIFIVVFIALTGLGTILGSGAEGKAIAQEKYVGYLIAAILLTSGAAIAKLIISIAETFG